MARKKKKKIQPSYIQQHQVRIKKEVIYSKNEIKSGMIVRFNYANATSPLSRRPLVLVLHPNFERKMHGLNLDNIPESLMDDLWNMTQLTMAGKVEKLIRLNIPFIKADIGNPRSFYYGRMQKWLKTYLGKTSVAYRTYGIEHITSLNIIDYRFEDSDYGGKSHKDRQEEQIRDYEKQIKDERGG